ncbi:MAG TPA: hypothetical protein DCW74_18400 [Alteromonas australica]|uniref:HTH arsR-type domain-containing protein n=1 Tax=Alteromonas australica TaxID=589873 RepID=A0A350P8S5_9ALTE|nr:hypothetical protein [Alteromonas australica]|tara:strand:- start:560 stop:892 length:333 start_codon:yes stop_codon:yes gene_type:complete
MAGNLPDSASNPRAGVSKIQNLHLALDDKKFQKIFTAITEHTELLALLSFRQPMSCKEIRRDLGFSKRTLHESLKRLTKVGVLIKINFEQHQLYVINGEHTSLIRSCLHS